MDLASVVAALASVGVRVSGSTPNNSIQGDSSRACPTGLAGPEPSGTHNDPGQHFHCRLHLYLFSLSVIVSSPSSLPKLTLNLAESSDHPPDAPNLKHMLHFSEREKRE